MKFTVLFFIFYFFMLNITQKDPLEEEKETQLESEELQKDELHVNEDEAEQQVIDIQDKIIVEEDNVILKDDDKVLELNPDDKLKDELLKNVENINEKDLDNDVESKDKADPENIKKAADENKIADSKIDEDDRPERENLREDEKEDLKKKDKSENIVDKGENVEAEDTNAEKPKKSAVLLAPGAADGPGEMGKPVKIDKPDPETKKLIDEGWKTHAFNQYVSDQISVHRSLPDLRDPWCGASGRLLPLSQLPSTSVIICFHNEAWSALLRTVHSVLDRSPAQLLQEIILVDDASEHDHLGSALEDYMAEYGKVKIIRLKERVGLIRARLAGASHSHPGSGVLTYLDSHCECMEGWLEPLLDRIARDPTTVVCPVIDVLNENTLAYQFSSYLAVGGFDWSLVFNWHAVPVRETKRKSHPWAPTHSPTMAGGLFSIDRNFFERLGTYDPGFDIWGGENLELSFKTWMCGGTLEIIPCSHVGHIFRKRSPYKWRTGVNVLKKNTMRLVEVWLDDYKEYYYKRNGGNTGDYGDVSSRKKLREGLNCKSFQWYLETIYPELFVPSESLASGPISSPTTGMCVDAAGGPLHHNKEVNLWPCHGQGGNQFWMFSKTGEIRRDDSCLDVSGHHVKLQKCHGARGNQWWHYDTEGRSLRHPASRRCLAVSVDTKKLVMEQCSGENSRQVWQLENFDLTKLKKEKEEKQQAVQQR